MAVIKSSNNLNQLKRLAIFAEVCELGSFAKAAKALGMSRSGVSEQVALLESYLSARLLHRTTRKLSLTLDGEMILEHANQIALELKTVEGKLLGDTMSGLIRLTTTHDFAIHWLTKRIKEFQHEHSDVFFDMVLSDSPIDLISQQIDLALRIGAPPSDSSLIARPLLSESLRIFASPELLANTPIFDSINDLIEEPWILLKQMINSRGMPLVAGKKRLNFSPSRVNLVDSPAVMIEQIKQSLGFGLLFPSIVEKEVKDGSLVQVLSEWRSEELLFYILYSSRQHMSLRVRSFIEHLVQSTATLQNS